MIIKNKRKSEPDLCMVLDQAADDIKTSINCISIGVIKTFYPDNQTADITLNYKRVNLYGSTAPIDYQLLVNCPVMVLNGGGGYISFPIASGDSCLVLFCDREIDTWFTNGGVNAPQSARVHDLNDGIAIVGINNALNSISYDKDRLKIFLGNGYITIDATGNIHLNSPTNIVLDAAKIDAKALASIDLAGVADALIRGAEVTLGMPSDSLVPYSTEDIRRVWVVTSVVGNAVTLEERRISLSRPPAPITRVVTVQ
jgi:hypothetical protein